MSSVAARQNLCVWDAPLDGKVVDVRLSTHLTNYPVCLSASEGISFDMEKTLSQIPDENQHFKAGKILEINPEHALFQALNNAYENDKDRLRDYAYLLYNQALLIEGFPIDNAEEYSRLVCELIAKSA